LNNVRFDTPVFAEMKKALRDPRSALAKLSAIAVVA
jgi:hypothetical protein